MTIFLTCGKKFYTSQVLGGYENTHKSERSHELRHTMHGNDSGGAVEEEVRRGQEPRISALFMTPSSYNQIRASPEAGQKDLTDKIDLSLKL
uniref:C2H2-type domain-containing protein n=1 Tax=Setaria italica TaxID=4555 RepID=K3ZMY7_SETIT